MITKSLYICIVIIDNDITMTYRVVQPQKNGKFYLYDVDAEWDPEKKRSKQKRTYLGPCDENGNLIGEPANKRTIECSPVFGPYHLLHSLAEDSGMASALTKVYGKEDGKRLLALAILGIVSPCSVRQMQNEIEDTYLRKIADVDWTFEQSGVCRFMQTAGKDAGRRERLFRALAPKGGCAIFDIVCLGTDSGELEFAEAGRKARLTGSKQFNLGMVHSMKDGLPFLYRTYPGSIADVTTLENMVSDLKAMGCKVDEMVLDRGFFSAGNIAMPIERRMGFTVPLPARNSIHKLLISESTGNIESPLCTDSLGGSAVRGYETAVILSGGEFSKASPKDKGGIRAVVFQDDNRRTIEISTLYRRMAELEAKMSGTEYEENISASLTNKEKEIADLCEFSAGEDGKTVVKRKRNAVSAKENACGRFAVLTTSKLGWKDLLIEYRKRNDVEYVFSQMQSDIFDGVTGKSSQDSAEGGLLVNFISLRLRSLLIDRMKEADLTDTMWVPDVISTLKKLKISCIGGKWRLNEITKAQRTVFEKLKVKMP